MEQLRWLGWLGWLTLLSHQSEEVNLLLHSVLFKAIYSRWLGWLGMGSLDSWDGMAG